MNHQSLTPGLFANCRSEQQHVLFFNSYPHAVGYEDDENEGEEEFYFEDKDCSPEDDGVLIEGVHFTAIDELEVEESDIDEDGRKSRNENQ